MLAIEVLPSFLSIKFCLFLQGRDDTRQDAVMQQVFSLVNELLRSDQSARLLSIRTYKIIPLSQRSGLLEWCEGTMPIGRFEEQFSNNMFSLNTVYFIAHGPHV